MIDERHQHAVATASGLQHLLESIDALPDPTFVVDAEMRLVAANRWCTEFFGADVDAVVGRTPVEWVHPDDLALVLSSFGEVGEKEHGTLIELRVRGADGRWHHIELIGATRSWPEGRHVVLTFRDLTDRRRWELAAGRPERLQHVLEHAAMIVMLVEPDGRIESVSRAMNRVLGHDPERIVGTPLTDFVVPDQRAMVDEALVRAARHREVTVFEADLLDLAATPIPYQLSIVNMLDDPVIGALVITATDITARRHLEARLAHLAARDPLTGLMNRAVLVAHLEGARQRSRRDPTRLAVLFIDLDRFKAVNDLFGHELGDRLLVEVANRLRQSMRPGDLVARVGGDEFVVVAEGLNGFDAAIELRTRLEAVIARPVALGDLTLQIHASVGCVRGDASSTSEGLLTEADAAMFEVKQHRRGVALPQPLRVDERRELAEELAAGLDRDPFACGLRCWYQPIVALPSARLHGLEALVRWDHPEHGLLTPDRFLPVAEQAGLDVRLGAYVLDVAVGHLARWGPRLPGGIAVNLSAAQLADPVLASHVGAVLEAYGVAPEQLCLEITESTMLERAARGGDPTAACVNALRDLGVRLSIDDFGTGYSSLVHVRDFPAHHLKVDRSFVAGMATDRAARGIVQAVVALGHGLGMTIVAEGVESPRQHELLHTMGADFAQGFRYGRPAPAAEVEATHRLAD